MNKIVCLTAGHSEVDSGATTTDKSGKLIKEAELATKFRNAVASYFHKHKDVKVKMDGYGNTNLPLAEAIKLIKGSDIALEFHFNSFTTKTAGGTETIALPDDKVIAQKISKAISDVLGTKLRGENGYIDQSKSARGRLGYVNAHGLIVEIAFLSNDTELQAFNDKYWLAAKAVYQTVCKHLGITPLV